MKKVLHKLTEFLKETWYFISSRIFLKNFGTMTTLLVLFWFTTFYWMGCYTHHGEKISVPDLEGMTIAQVEQTLRGPNLKYKVIDSIYRNDKPTRSVLEQNPTAKSKVKESRTIYLTVNAFTAPEVTFPRVWGKDYDYSVAQLKSCCGIKIGEIEEIVDRAANTIIEIRYNGKILKDPGERGKAIKMPKYSTIDLTIAKGSGVRVEVPRLQCMTMDKAQFIISNSNLNLGSIIADPTVIDTASAYVWKQYPRYSEGATMNMGEQVNIYISQDPKGCPEDGDFETNDAVIPTPENTIPDDDGNPDDEFEEEEEEEEFEYGGK